MPAKDIKKNHQNNSEATIQGAQLFVKENPPKELNENELARLVKDKREEIQNLGSDDFRGALTGALKNLEYVRAARSGIILHEREHAGVPIIVRDARNAKTPMQLGTEGFEMQYLNTIRASLDLIDHATPQYDTVTKEGLKRVLQEKTKRVIKEFAAYNGDDNLSNKKQLSQKALSKKMSSHITEVTEFLRKEGKMKDVYKHINPARDFQNFNDEHRNTVTLISQKSLTGSTLTHLEIDVAQKMLTTEQKNEYEKIKNTKDINSNELPKWFQALPIVEKTLCKQYVNRIIGGKHVMPTQLRNLLGGRNAGTKITAVMTDGDKPSFEVISKSHHSGTIASSSPNKGIRLEIAKQNAKQLAGWVPNPYLNVLNTRVTLPGVNEADAGFAKDSEDAMQSLGYNVSVTAFNAYRYVGAANNVKDIDKILGEIANSITSNDGQSNSLKNHLNGTKPISAKEAKELISQVCGKDKPINPEGANVLIDAVELKEHADELKKTIRFSDPENNSLQTAYKLNQLSFDIQKLTGSSLPRHSQEGQEAQFPQMNGLNLDKLPIFEPVDACASGKDRTGLAMFFTTVKSFMNFMKKSTGLDDKKFGIDEETFGKNILAAGHTGNQAGSIYSGGGTIGCYGTKKENRVGIPQSYKPWGEEIIEVTAQTNKVKKPSRFKLFKLYVRGIFSKTPEEEQLKVPASFIKPSAPQGVESNKAQEVPEHTHDKDHKPSIKNSAVNAVIDAANNQHMNQSQPMRSQGIKQRPNRSSSIPGH